MSLEPTMRWTMFSSIALCSLKVLLRLVVGELVLVLVLDDVIVNRGEWLGSPANIKGANKDAKILVGRSTTVQNLLFWTHTLCMNYITDTILMVSSSVSIKQLLYFGHGQGQNSEQKHTRKNFVKFRNHSPLLTMMMFKCKIYFDVTEHRVNNA